ncbi:nucleotide sugar dehydrogenase [Formosa sp. L2A11]|uniref:nucleotide sugar dehydrogenase n=1 Tax=Formosa sp. L2A11 TaxID=2686363 RepID=UPI00131B67D6|nr:nucleotide sugar dehydrogenase [Formosa sp. L2A11]
MYSDFVENAHKKTVAIIGLGYVGLPLAVEFAKQYNTIGFDVNETRVAELKAGADHTLEVSPEHLKAVLHNEDDLKLGEKGFFPTNDLNYLSHANIFIVTVPTPTDKNNRPVLIPLIKASETVGKVLKKGDIVIYESTVYPGVTEEECVPVLEAQSGLKFNTDFFAGYSPERINPGDKEHTVAKILKVTSGSTPEIAEVVDQLYKSVITAGTFKATSIKVAEAAKVIENSQRDINIAFVNELAKIFNLLGINTHDVLEAAGTKWNFLPFKPGLVGGHCIGVDPYYLAQKAQESGYHPEIILAGRRLNDSMGDYVCQEIVKEMIGKGQCVKGAKSLILGITFKENCPDIRNTKAIDIYHGLRGFYVDVDVYDPWANASEVKREFNIDLVKDLKEGAYQSVVLAVSHKEFLSLDVEKLKTDNGIIYDVKGVLPAEIVTKRL